MELGGGDGIGIGLGNGGLPPIAAATEDLVLAVVVAPAAGAATEGAWGVVGPRVQGLASV